MIWVMYPTRHSVPHLDDGVGHVPDTPPKKKYKNDVGHIPNTSVILQKNDVGHVPDTSVLQKTNKQTNRKNDMGHVPDTPYITFRI